MKVKNIQKQPFSNQPCFKTKFHLTYCFLSEKLNKTKGTLVHDRELWALFSRAGIEPGTAVKSNLNKHIASVHDGKKPFKCNICEASFPQKQNLNIHIASVHEGKKPFKCNSCDASFVSKHGLTVHIYSVHEFKKPFKCNDCSMSFSLKGNLNRHVTSLHERKQDWKAFSASKAPDNWQSLIKCS